MAGCWCCTVCHVSQGGQTLCSLLHSFTGQPGDPALLLLACMRSASCHGLDPGPEPDHTPS